MATIQRIYQLKGVDNRFKSAKGLLDPAVLLQANIDEINRAVLNETAERIVEVTGGMKKQLPVDTGTYMISHHVAGGRQGSVARDESSHGKPRNQMGRASQFQNESLTNMRAEIAALPDGGTDEARFYNTAFHAKYVEYIGWKDRDGNITPAYNVYGKTKNEFNNIVAAAKAKLGIK